MGRAQGSAPGVSRRLRWLFVNETRQHGDVTIQSNITEYLQEPEIIPYGLKQPVLLSVTHGPVTAGICYNYFKSLFLKLSLFVSFWDRFSLCSCDQSKTHYVDEISLKTILLLLHQSPPTSPQGLRLWVCTAMPTLNATSLFPSLFTSWSKSLLTSTGRLN